MKTPIYDFVKEYADKNSVRLHMPGAKGRGDVAYKYDITEIIGADSLFEADGIIKESEENASKLFGTGATFYSAGGSTLCIQAMLGLVKSFSNDDSPIILAVRNAHKAFINACILLGLDVSWIFPRYLSDSIVSGEVTAELVRNAVLSCKKKPQAVYITSPDYLGKVCDIKSIADYCHSNGILLLVDNAHGAYQCFLQSNNHPIFKGADMCCDSAHKTLPVLTGGAYLHLSKDLDRYFKDNTKAVMSMFASTSPSYLILTSLDLCNKYIYEKIRDDLKFIIPQINELRQSIFDCGFEMVSQEPLKITVNANSAGLTGNELANLLRERNIEVEYSDYSFVLLMFSTFNTSHDITITKDAFLSISAHNTNKSKVQLPGLNFSPVSVMSMHRAAFLYSETVSSESAVGRICSKTVVACPPGIPVVVSGELITDDIIKILQRYSIFCVNVVKSNV